MFPVSIVPSTAGRLSTPLAGPRDCREALDRRVSANRFRRISPETVMEARWVDLAAAFDPVVGIGFYVAKVGLASLEHVPASHRERRCSEVGQDRRGGRHQRDSYRSRTVETVGDAVSGVTQSRRIGGRIRGASVSTCAGRIQDLQNAPTRGCSRASRRGRAEGASSPACCPT